MMPISIFSPSISLSESTIPFIMFPSHLCRSQPQSTTYLAGNHAIPSVDECITSLPLTLLLVSLLSVILLHRYYDKFEYYLLLLQQGHLLDITPQVIAVYFDLLFRKQLNSNTSHCSHSGSLLDIGGDIRVVDTEPVAWGSFADVYEATYQGRRVALKRIRISRSLSDEEKRRCFRAFQREVRICIQLNHPHILPICGIDYTTFPTMPCIVLPWMAHGNFYSATKSLGVAKTRSLVPRWLLEVARGVRYLHSCSIVHGDLRGANVLFDEQYRVRVCDFGLSHRPEDNNDSILAYLSRNPRWAAPELLRSEGEDVPLCPDTQCDVYSFGCLCIEFYTQKSPFQHLRDYQVLPAILKGVRPLQPDDDLIPGKIWNLAERCWAEEPQDRPPMSEVEEEVEKSYGIG